MTDNVISILQCSSNNGNSVVTSTYSCVTTPTHTVPVLSHVPDGCNGHPGVQQVAISDNGHTQQDNSSSTGIVDVTLIIVLSLDTVALTVPGDATALPVLYYPVAMEQMNP